MPSPHLDVHEAACSWPRSGIGWAAIERHDCRPSQPSRAFDLPVSAGGVVKHSWPLVVLLLHL